MKQKVIRRLRLDISLASATWCMAIAAAGPTTGPAPTDANSGAGVSSLPQTRSDGDLTNLSLEDLMNVDITSDSKKKQSMADAPAAITVIRQDISRSGFSTIPDLLRLVPGMDVARVNSSTWAINARGLNDQFALSDVVHFQSTKDDNLHRVFAQDAITLEPERWVFTLGSKFEYNDYSGFKIQPSTWLMWTPDKHNTFWSAVSRAVRTPSRVENDIDFVQQRFQQPVALGVTVPAQVDFEGNHNPESEELITYELGYRLQPIKRVSIDIATSYNNYNKLTSAATQSIQPGTSLIIPVQAGNKIHGDTWGGEIATTIEMTSQWRLSGSYSLMETAFHDDRVSTDTVTAKTDEGMAPEHQFQIHSCLNVTNNVQFNAALYYVGRVPEFDIPIPSYFSTDLNVTWQIKEGMNLQVGVVNLFDDSHSEFGVTGVTMANDTPRTIYAS